MWHLNEEANTIALEDNLNRSNEAMVAAVAKAKNWKGKEREKDKDEKRKRCSNCKKTGHTNKECFEEGGGQAHNPAEWWLERKQKRDPKRSKGKSANAAEKSDDNNNESDNLAMLTYTLPNDPSILQCTSDFKHEAHTITKSNGTILDCGASSHFSPERSKFLNY